MTGDRTWKEFLYFVMGVIVLSWCVWGAEDEHDYRKARRRYRALRARWRGKNK